MEEGEREKRHRERSLLPTCSRVTRVTRGEREKDSSMHGDPGRGEPMAAE